MSVSPRRPTALVLEDQYLIAANLEFCLAEMGWDVILAHTLPDAISALERQHLDLALVDYHIGNVTSVPLMQRLAAEGIPFALCSGSMADEIPDLAANAIVLSKPFTDADIRAAVSRLVGQPTALA